MGGAALRCKLLKIDKKDAMYLGSKDDTNGPELFSKGVMRLMSSHSGNLPWLSKTGRLKIAVLGDVILDEYLEGQVNRISPEAPVPVHLVERTTVTPGGAANAARNIACAGGMAMLFGVIGQDEAGQRLTGLLRKDEINVDGLVAVKDRPTVRKTRVTSASQQIVRIDWEKSHPVATATQELILAALKRSEFHGLLISDYGKGVLTPELLQGAINEAVRRGVPVVVDPKGRDFRKYLSATVITPNRKEACEALGLDPTDKHDGEELGVRLRDTFGLQNILVTLGSKGMVMVPAVPGEPVLALPAIAREVYDVSGAGDTVAAIMALGLAARVSMQECMNLANRAAAIVVGKWGTQPVYLSELQAALSDGDGKPRAHSSTLSKIHQAAALKSVLKTPKERQHKVVFTNGCFDILHAGHVTYLEAARAMGDVLVVAVNSDASVSRLKGPTRPYVSLENRMRLLAALAAVDYVVSFDEATPASLIAELLPDVLVKGADWAKDQIAGADIVLNAGGVVDNITLVPGLSTTALVQRIKEG